MGGVATKVKDHFHKDPPVDGFFTAGFYRSGKSTLIYRLNHTSDEQPVEDHLHRSPEDIEVKHGDRTIFVRDEQSGRKPEPWMIRHYLRNFAGFLFVIDSTDPERLDYVLERMDDYFLKDEALGSRVLLVAANKQDVESAMTPAHIETAIKQKCSLSTGISVIVMPTSGVTGEGVQLAFNYFWTLILLKRMKVLKSGLIPHAWEKAAAQLEKKNFDSILKAKLKTKTVSDTNTITNDTTDKESGNSIINPIELGLDDQKYKKMFYNIGAGR